MSAEVDSLSQENINKLHLNGIYRCSPVVEWLPIWKRQSPYWCVNWTFKVIKMDSDSYYMRDTYWSTGYSFTVKLTDENFDKFEYLFDINEVQRVYNYEEFLKYPEEDRWNVALNSGGINYRQYIVRRGTKKIKEVVIEGIEEKIKSLKSQLESQERILDGILNGELDYNYY